jgi:hypothetical protein
MRILGSLLAATVLSACAYQPAAMSKLSPPEKLAALCQSRVLTADDKTVCQKNMREATPDELPAVVAMTEAQVAMRASQKRARTRRQGDESMHSFNNNNNNGYYGYTSRGAFEQATGIMENRPR